MSQNLPNTKSLANGLLMTHGPDLLERLAVRMFATRRTVLFSQFLTNLRPVATTAPIWMLSRATASHMPQRQANCTREYVSTTVLRSGLAFNSPLSIVISSQIVHHRPCQRPTIPLQLLRERQVSMNSSDPPPRRVSTTSERKVSLCSSSSETLRVFTTMILRQCNSRVGHT